MLFIKAPTRVSQYVGLFLPITNKETLRREASFVIYFLSASWSQALSEALECTKE